MLQGKKLSDFFMRNRCYEKHINKLKEISKKRPKRYSNQLEQTFNIFKQRSKRFFEEQYEKQMLSENRKVYQKLMSIQQRQPLFLNENNSTIHQKSHIHHHSYYVHKQQLKQIEQENRALLKRLKEKQQNSLFDHRKHSEQFLQNRKIKERIEKFPYLNSVNKKLKIMRSSSIQLPIKSVKKRRKFKTQDHSQS